MLKKPYGFTLIELLVVISIIALLIGILLPALGAARRSARQIQNNTQVRGIHQAMVTYAQSAKTYYPGLDGDGYFLPDGAAGEPDGSGHGGTVERRFAILLDGNFFTGDYAISPLETKVAWTTGEVDSGNYSYAMLDIYGPGDVTDRSIKPREAGRIAEWSDTLNTEAAIISDRARGSLTDIYSIHTDDGSNDWRGSIAWTDTHTVFETTELQDVKYGKFASITDDNIFGLTQNTEATVNGTLTDYVEANAIMVYEGDDDWFD